MSANAVGSGLGNDASHRFGRYSRTCRGAVGRPDPAAAAVGSITSDVLRNPPALEPVAEGDVGQAEARGGLVHVARVVERDDAQGGDLDLHE
jgi:hypothetical protein